MKFQVLLNIELSLRSPVMGNKAGKKTQDKQKAGEAGNTVDKQKAGDTGNTVDKQKAGETGNTVDTQKAGEMGNIVNKEPLGTYSGFSYWSGE